MGQINVIKDVDGIKGLCVITPAVHGDSRGYFYESYNQNDMKENGIDITFVQDNQSMSVKGVLRGLHFQKNYPQTKLVRVIKGEVFDVAVDLRKDSETYGRWHGEILSEENKKQFLVPRGFAHGFLTLTDDVEVQYKADNYYSPEHDGGVRWDDPEIGVEWPIAPLILSDKDKNAPTLAERMAEGLNFVYEGERAWCASSVQSV